MSAQRKPTSWWCRAFTFLSGAVKKILLLYAGQAVWDSRDFHSLGVCTFVINCVSCCDFLNDRAVSFLFFYFIFFHGWTRWIDVNLKSIKIPSSRVGFCFSPSGGFSGVKFDGCLTFAVVIGELSFLITVIVTIWIFFFVHVLLFLFFKVQLF